jgi:hypothetical protein
VKLPVLIGAVIALIVAGCSRSNSDKTASEEILPATAKKMSSAKSKNIFPISPDGKTDQEQFGAILSYWRENILVERGLFDGYFCDGPEGTRVHVAIPAECVTLYSHAFDGSFLESQRQSKDMLTRKVAQDLKFLRHEHLFRRSSQAGEDSRWKVKYEIVGVRL